VKRPLHCGLRFAKGTRLLFPFIEIDAPDKILAYIWDSGSFSADEVGFWKEMKVK
jgi:hypothetical protein